MATRDTTTGNVLDAARDHLAGFLAAFGPDVAHFALDVKGQVVLGHGWPIADEAEAATCAAMLVRAADGLPAGAEAAVADWEMVGLYGPSQAARPEGAKYAPGFFGPLTALRLTPAGRQALVAARYDQLLAAAVVEPQLADVADWPPDARLALVSRLWGAPRGPAALLPTPLADACARHDWPAAASWCASGEHPRDPVHRTLFIEAAATAAAKNGTAALGGGPLRYAFVERPQLRLGAANAHVVYLQQRLSTLGYPVAVSGILGSTTASAVRRFKIDAHLDADPTVDLPTWRTLG